MRGLILGILAFVTATTSGVVGQEPTFRSSTRIVPVVATVIEEQGRFVPGLEQDQFTILDNGVPQEITFFQNDVQPFTVVVMLDYSASMTANLDRLQAAAEQFVLRMIPEDKGQVGSFSDKIQFSGTFTNDRDDLIFFQDQVNLTGGLHFWFRQVRLNTAVNVPVVGPRPWAVEAMAYLNWYF